jgi:FMN phosphatase YigB (HAD superfamily)
MIRGLLLDLDNTLLDIDVDAFVERYTRAVAARVMPDDPGRGWALVAGASYRMLAERDSSETNRARFLAALAQEAGEDADRLWRHLEEASTALLPELEGMARARPGVRSLVAEAHRRGLRVALATNPIYPRPVIVERMRWAGLDASDVDHVAAMDACRDTKPHAAYFAGLADALGLDLGECLMVGDDPDQDIPDRPTPLSSSCPAARSRPPGGRCRPRRGRTRIAPR